MIDFKKMNVIQWISILIIVFLIGNLIFFAFRKGSTLYFWIFIVLAAIYAFIILPMFMKMGAAKTENKKDNKEHDEKERKDAEKKKEE